MDLERKMISFTVPGDPIPQPRPRVTSRGVYYAERARGSKRMSYVDYKEWVATHLKASLFFEPPSLNEFSLSLKIFFKKNGLGDSNAILATYMDALQGIVWINDRQVAETHTKRLFNTGNARVEIEIEEVK